MVRMTSTDLNNFLKALDVLKSDYTCGFCSEMCTTPVTFKCFHMICAKHDNLKYCPTCKIPLDNYSTVVDERLKACVDSAIEIDRMVEKLRPKDITQKKETKITQPRSKDRLNETIVSSASSKFNKTLEKRNAKGETCLHVACRLGKADKIKELLISGANTNTKDNAGWTPLHEVVQNGRQDLANLLLQYNTLIDVPGQGNETPLHEAVRYNHKQIAVDLVKNGANMHARNCKGETPYQLASTEFKNLLLVAADNIIQTQTVNISHMSTLHAELEFDDIHVYCTSQYRTTLNKLKNLAKSHSNLTIEAKLTRKVTHILVDTEDGICKSNVDVLQGIVYNMWIISSDWVIQSTEDNLEPFEKYEVIGVGTKYYNGPKNARWNKYKQHPGIFNGCHFYLHNFNTKYEVSKTLVLTKSILTKLITDAGGIVLKRVPNPELIPENEKLVPFHANKESSLVNTSHYIIFKDSYEPMYNMQHLKALPIGWLIECLEKYELCEPWHIQPSF